MSADDLVSVVVPSYNHAHYISDTLASISGQSFPDLELIVVDDASTDESVRLIESWTSLAATQARFARVTVITHDTNQGAAGTISEGIEAASGQLIFLANSDDVFEPDRVVRLHARLAGQRYGLGFSRVRYVDADGVPAVSQAAIRYERDVDWIMDQLPSVGFGFLHGQWAVSTGNLAFSKDLFQALHGFADLEYCHDWDFVLRATLLTEPVFVPEYLYRYRVHESNSYLGLSHLADRETRAVIARFWAARGSQPVLNPLAPTPENWPGVFDILAQRVAAREAIDEVSQALPRYVRRRAESPDRRLAT